MAKTRSSLSFLFVLVFLGIAAGGGYTLLHDLQGPAMSLLPDNGGRIGPAQNLSLTLRDQAGVRSVSVVIKRGAQSMTLLTRHFDSPRPEENLVFNLREANLPEGAFELEVKAYDASYAGFGKGNGTTLLLPMRLDTQPPRIAVKTVPPGIRRGGSALILYTVSEETEQTGVSVADLFFPGYRQPNGAYVCLFPFPYTMTTADFSPEIMARDPAGNTTSSRLLVNAQGRTFKDDKLTVDDRFLDAKADELAGLCPEGENPLERYLCANRSRRVADDAYLLQLGQKTGPVFLWSGPFQRLPRSAVKAGFADSRTYYYRNEKIDSQIHTGLDLASVPQAEVPATNAGRVVHAAPLGIYGNMVAVDHGIGLMSIYSHLTEIRVAEGDTVETGQIVGTTGTTGLAGGDHVHYGILVGGVPVQPLEWLDPAWVRNNITNRLNTPL